MICWLIGWRSAVIAGHPHGHPRTRSFTHSVRHLASECVVTRQRKSLVQEAEARRKMLAQAEAEARKAKQLQQDMDREQQRLEWEATAEPEKQLDRLQITGEGGAVAASGPASVPASGADATQVACPLCGEALKQMQLARHLRHLCLRRRVMCPNFYTGCEQKLVPLNVLAEHLRVECRSERLREQMIAQSKQRREKVQCPACGHKIPLLQLKQHELEKCRNRKVPCRNHALGCRVMVRLSERHLHEKVVGSGRQVRCALYLGGHGAHLAIEEGVAHLIQIVLIAHQRMWIG